MNEVTKTNHILLIEDDAVDRKAIIRILRRAQCACDIAEAANGSDGLAYLQRQPFDCVLLDFHLPDATGLEILRRIRQEKIDTPVIMLTGQQDAKAVAELMKAGAADYIAKDSLAQNNLEKTMQSVIRTHRAERESAAAAVELRRTAAKLTRAQQIARMGDWEWDVATQQMSWSPELYDLFGIAMADRETAVTDLFAAVVHPDDYAAAKEADAQTRQGQATNVEYRIRLPDGHICYMHSWSELVTDSTGQVAAVAGVAQDITRRKEAELGLQEQKELFENLVAVARATIESPTLNQTLHDALEVSLKITGADSGFLFLLENGQPSVVEFINPPWPLTAVDTKTLAVQCLQDGLESWVVQERQAALIADTSQDSRWSDIAGAKHTGSAISLPIMQRTAVIGIITLLHPQPNQFTPQTISLMTAAVDQMTLAISNAQIFDSQRNMVGQQTTLYETLRALSGQTNVNTVARLATNTIAQFTGWPNVSIAALSPEKKEWRIISAYGQLASETTGLTLPADKGILGRALRTGEAQYVPDVRLDPDHIPSIETTRSELAIPLYRSQEIFAILDVQAETAEAFPPDDLSLAYFLGDLLSLSLESARLFQTVQEERGRLQAIIQSSQDGLIMVGVDQHILVINQPAMRLLNLPGVPDDWIGNNILRVLSSVRHTSPQAARALINQHRARNVDQTAYEGELEIKLRTIRWQDLPVMGGPNLLGRLFVLQDITQARSLEKLREDMTHTMVHDLRNPLMAINYSIELLQEVGQDFSPMMAKMIDMADRSSERMLALVNNILDISQLESGQMPFDPQPFSLADLIQNECAVQMSLAVQKEISLTHRLPTDLPPAWGDPELMQRVLQNLMGNALKFTPEGGEVQVLVEQINRSGKPTLQIEVQDSGPGIPPEIRERLFTKFTTGMQAASGNGLGLAYCKSAIVAHDQKIWVADNPQGGATFAFTLAVADLE